MPEISELISQNMPNIRGKVLYSEPLSPFTWFKVGGAADAIFSPIDSEDLAYFLKNLPAEIPIFTLGLGSNIIIRDGGVRGIVIRLNGKGFNQIIVEGEHTLRVGAAVPDVKLARAAAEAGIDGLTFFRGIPGSIGGALRMNAGAHGGETKDCFLSATGIDRKGNIHQFTHDDMGFVYRNAQGVPADVIFTQAIFKGLPGDPQKIKADMEEVAAKREATQPIKERTGGSIFKNPQGHSAWKLIDEAGCRGLKLGGAQVSQMHCNFLLNVDNASAADIENLGEEVRRRVKENSGVDLHWEIKRIGEIKRIEEK